MQAPYLYNKGYDYDQRLPQVLVYQVEFNAIATGKIFAMSKRRIRWRYGFPNKEAIDAGEMGTRCRGEEHDVTLIWSVTSGKQMILANARQIHSGNHRSSIFEHQWTDERGNVIKLVAHSIPPKSEARQYDLFINGVSFFSLPKAFEIGLKASDDGRIPGVITQRDRASFTSSTYRQTFNYTESGRHLVPNSQDLNGLNREIENSLKESRDHLASKGKLGDGSMSPRLKTQMTSQEPQPPKEEALIDLLSDDVPDPNNSSALVLVDVAPQYGLGPFAYNSVPPAHSNPFDYASQQQHAGYNQQSYQQQGYQQPEVTNNFTTQQTNQQPAGYYQSPTMNNFTQPNY